MINGATGMLTGTPLMPGEKIENPIGWEESQPKSNNNLPQVELTGGSNCSSSSRFSHYTSTDWVSSVGKMVVINIQWEYENQFFMTRQSDQTKIVYTLIVLMLFLLMLLIILDHFPQSDFLISLSFVRPSSLARLLACR